MNYSGEGLYINQIVNSKYLLTDNEQKNVSEKK